MIYPKKFCIGITGTLKTMTVETAISLIHDAGCEYATTIGADTTCMIVGANPNGQDMLTAERFNIDLVWEAQFAKKMTQHHCLEEKGIIVEVSEEHKIAVTGVLESMTRQGAINAIERAGYNYSPTVTVNTTHLVVGATPGLEKIAKAEEGGIIFIMEDEFLRMIGASHTGILPGLE